MIRVIMIGIALLLAGCSNLPVKDGGVEIGKDTTAGIDDFGVGRIDRKF
jgi:hypothetical protein